MKDGPLKKIIGTLGKLGLPALGTAIGGPAGGVIASTIGGLLGVDGKDGDAIETALANASPETLAKLKEIEASIAIAENETARNESDNVTARHAADMNSQSWLSQNIRPFTLVAMLAFWFLWTLATAIVVCVFYIQSGEVSEAITGFFITVGMQIVGLLGTVVAFYFGSRGIENVKLGKARDRQ